MHGRLRNAVGVIARARVLALGVGLGVVSCAGLHNAARSGAAGITSEGSLSTATIIDGLKQALELGTAKAVDITSAANGFLKNAAIRILVPESLDPMVKALRTVGMGGMVDELEVKMNRAAEHAAGDATDVFWSAIKNMTIDDARGILDGGDTAATDYFRRVTSQPLRERFQPIVVENMQSVGLASLYDGMKSRYEAIPFLSGAKPMPDLNDYVTDKTLDGLFTVLGEQERLIREDPAARTTALLQRVFGR